MKTPQMSTTLATWFEVLGFEAHGQERIRAEGAQICNTEGGFIKARRHVGRTSCLGS